MARKVIKKPVAYKYGGHNVPGMFKGNLPKAQFGLDWLKDKAEKIKKGYRKYVKPNVSKGTTKKVKDVANRINTFFGGDSDYWRKGGGLR